MATANERRPMMEFRADQAVLAESLVLGLGDPEQLRELWCSITKCLTPVEFLLVWNECQAELAALIGPHVLVHTIQIFNDGRRQIFYADLNDPPRRQSPSRVSMN